MERKIEQVQFQNLTPKKKRVAAYARVSSGKDAMLHSLSAQVSYYSSLIQSHPDWEYVGVYADEAVTGTKDSRTNFRRLLQDSKEGKIDIVLTKSISRFARNTLTLLETIRELKNTGVDVFFEEQNIHSLSCDGELMLTILASYAQEESLSVSENMKWRIQKNFEEGKPWSGFLLGYRFENGQYVIVQEEAEIIRCIYREYLDGKGANLIMKGLNADGLVTRVGHKWSVNAVMKILKNYNYTGNLILQKTYRENHITKKKMKNTGQLPQYHAMDTHEAIIDLEIFEAVQKELARRADKFVKHKSNGTPYPFTGMIRCGICGKNYRRKTTATGIVWVCTTYNTHGKSACASKAIPESKLEELVADMNMSNLTAIQAVENNTLVFCFKDGSQTVKRWKDRSRAESWTPEMKEAARQKSLAKNK